MVEHALLHALKPPSPGIPSVYMEPIRETPDMESETIPVPDVVKAMKARFESEFSKIQEKPSREYAILLVGYKDAIIDLAYDLLPSEEFLELGRYLGKYDDEIDGVRKTIEQ